MSKDYTPLQIALAFEAIAKANHYMVGFIGKVSDHDLSAACGVLTMRQSLCTPDSKRWRLLELALELIETYRREDQTNV
jgi:hypothetical protein